MQTPREIFTRCLKFQYPERIPRDLWLLPWAEMQFPGKVQELKRRFPPDIVDAPWVYCPSPRVRGDAYGPGLYTDEWGSVFTNIQRGAIGEVRSPMIREIANWKDVNPPYETLPGDRTSARERVNRFCGGTDLFTKAPCCPRPWERFQFLRGTENAMLDVMYEIPSSDDVVRVHINQSVVTGQTRPLIRRRAGRAAA